MIRRLFLEHPRAVGEGYFAHMGTALGFAGTLLGAGLACGVHALVPALCERTASRAIARLHDRMVVHRSRQPVAGGAAPVTARS
ncbi:DUF6356 family protein [Sphingomonas morindae]|uniref:DUF6356 family protein n=1 Tax=Sphingomonas morindae TaxID=1541170 RepID=A0ABY4X8C9_9SPHN|nr:DUF6356 family protein [Sphingomonas morindae]USI73150.1 DUF6356 family protein [Sphingomonas morindae]